MLINVENFLTVENVCGKLFLKIYTIPIFCPSSTEKSLKIGVLRRKNVKRKNIVYLFSSKFCMTEKCILKKIKDRYTNL